jgi:acetyl-CoA acetyltransferase
VTAGNASGVNDGACALLLANEEAAQQYGLVPRARVVGMATAGVARASWASAPRRPRARCWRRPA